MRDPDQKMRFNHAELSLVKGLFADNEEMLFIVRKVMLQAKLSEQEEIRLKKVINPQTFALLKKFFLPDLELDTPLFQLTDMYVGLQNELKLGPVEAMPYIQAKDLEVEYLAQQLEVLKNISEAKEPKIVLKDLTKPTKDIEKRWVNITVRNYLLSFIDTNIQQIKFLAGTKEESVEETQARLKQDSNK